MAQFGFENDIHSILKLDMPITNAPMARWQRKASSSNTSALSGLSPGKSANVSLSSSKTPSKTPGSVFVCIYTRMSGKALQMLTTGKFFFIFYFFFMGHRQKQETNPIQDGGWSLHSHQKQQTNGCGNFPADKGEWASGHKHISYISKLCNKHLSFYLYK